MFALGRSPLSPSFASRSEAVGSGTQMSRCRPPERPEDRKPENRKEECGAAARDGTAAAPTARPGDRARQRDAVGVMPWG
ncbi:hypothetical protein SUDANB15_06751 [Streptomyces sp. enrichment culture]